MSLKFEGAKKIAGVTVVFHDSSDPKKGILLPKILPIDDGGKVEQVLVVNGSVNGKRALHQIDEYAPGVLQNYQYGMLGGGAKESESLIDALIREITEEIDEAMESLGTSEEALGKRLGMMLYVRQLATEIRRMDPREFIHFPSLRVAQWKAKKDTGQHTEDLGGVESTDIDQDIEVRGIISIAALMFDISKIPGLEELLLAIGFTYVDPTNPEDLKKVRPYGQVVLPMLAKDLATKLTESVESQESRVVSPAAS